MNLSKIFNSILLGYLVLLLNFGPSFHRAPIFGLHDHDHHPTLHLAHVECDCGHDHGHGPTESENNRHDSDSERSSTLAIEKQLCDCSLCQFFKHFNASVDTVDLTIAEATLSFRVETGSSLISRSALATDARGPPMA